MGYLKADPARHNLAMHRKAELALRLKPHRVKVITCRAQIGQHIQKIGPYKMAQHEFVLQLRAPAHQRPINGLAPEHGG